MKNTEQVHDEGTNPITRLIHRHGGIVAMAAAAALTAKGEWDLAVMVEYPKGIAWLLPVALDVYLATAAAKRARADVFIGLVLMMGCQVAVHLTGLVIDERAGEVTPWGLVVAVVCVPPIIALRTTLGMRGKREGKSPELLAAEEAERVAREAAADADRRRVETAARLREEQEGRAAELAAAETRLREEREAREAAEQAARDAREKADRAAFRASRASTQRDGDAVPRRTPTQPVTQTAEPTDAPVTHGVTHQVTQNGDAPARDASTRDASTRDASRGVPLTREERLTLAVIEVQEGTAKSARAAALKYDVDVQAVQRRVRAERQSAEQGPLARAGADPTPSSTSTQ